MLENNQVIEVSLTKNGLKFTASYFVQDNQIYADINGKTVQQDAGTIPPRLVVRWLLEDEIKAALAAKEA